MKVHGKHYRTIWLSEDNPNVVQIIDQRLLPHKFVVEDLKTVADVARAIKKFYLISQPVVNLEHLGLQSLSRDQILKELNQRLPRLAMVSGY